jgi:ATP synthase subunit 6
MLIVKNQSNSIRNFKSFTMLYFVFIFIVFLNFFSLSPFTTSVSGHIMIALSLSLVFFISFIFEGFLNNRLNFLYFFYPSNVPVFLLFFLIVIEVLSFLIRPFSLAIRLFANMLAGHTLLNIFGTFALFVADDFSMFHIFPYIFCLLIGFLEFGVAFIQAYVFVILLSIYISDITIIKH